MDPATTMPTVRPVGRKRAAGVASRGLPKRSHQAARGLATVVALSAAAAAALGLVRAFAIAGQPPAASAAHAVASATEEQGRRSLLRDLAVGLVGSGVAASVAGDAALAADTPSKWAGTYSDFAHDGCERRLYVAYDGLSGKIVGRDNPEGKDCRTRELALQWSLKFTLDSADGNEIRIEEGKRSVSSRDRREDGKDTNIAVARWDGDGILFPDGIKWKKAKGSR